MAKLKSSLSERRATARKLDLNFKRQQELLNEAAAAFVARGQDVPQELGQALGAIVRRQHLFKQVSQVLCESASGIGLEKIVKRFLAEIEPHNKNIAKALEVVHQAAIEQKGENNEG